MSLPTVDVDVPPRHVDGGFPKDWMAVRTAANVIIVHEPGDMGTDTYTLADTTTNPRVMAAADAIMWEGSVADTIYEDGLVLIQHAHSGIKTRLPVGEMLEEAVPTLALTDVVRLEGVGGIVEYECSDCGKQVERERHDLDLPGVTPQRCTSCTFDKMGGASR
jgi:DNA-directed RNA polymerase subunit RPC12/RpoP